MTTAPATPSHPAHPLRRWSEIGGPSLQPLPTTQSNSTDDLTHPAGSDPRFLARMIDWLVRPPAITRSTAVIIVLGLCALIGFAYVALRGTVTMQGFYLLPIILAVSWLGLGWGVFIAVLTAILRACGDFATTVLNPDYYFAAADLSRVISNRVSGLLLFLFFAVVVHELILLSRQLEQRVQARTRALQQAVAARQRLQTSLFEAGVRERNAIGRDLHDGLGQHLTATAMAARILAGRLQSCHAEFARDARKLCALITDAIDQTRRIARGLLLDNVPPENLASELDELVATANQNHGVPCSVVIDGEAAGLDVTITSHLFYIAREALRNALRHSGATRIAVQLTVTAADVHLSVTDNGLGLPNLPADSSGVGLHIMTQRAEFIGGSVTIHNPAAGGTRVECIVPLTPID